MADSEPAADLDGLKLRNRGVTAKKNNKILLRIVVSAYIDK
jgi:hypothetical protein